MMHQMQALAQKQVNPYAYVSNFSSNSAYPCSKNSSFFSPIVSSVKICD